jgi:signal peptidase I
LTVLIFLIVSYILLSISLYFLFPKAQVAAWKGLVPGLNFLEWAGIIGRKKWYTLWLLFPIVNLFIFVSMSIDLVRSFGKYGFIDEVITFFYAPISFFRLAFDKEAKYVGPTVIQEREYHHKLKEAKKEGNSREYNKLMARNPYKKSIGREWTESLVFAIFAAAFIRMFLIEAYVIPTPSMEGSLNVGDFLFVSKAHYGIRTPMTVAMVPLLHNRIPYLNTESYLKKPSLPYYRLKALESIKRGSPFVFNWPVGDSVYLTQQRPYTVKQVELSPEIMNYDRELKRKVNNKDFIVRPIDKKDHYIKRCVAIAGDTLQIIDREIYINGEKQPAPEHRQFLYYLKKPLRVNKKKLDDWGVDAEDAAMTQRGNIVGYYLDEEQYKKINEASGDSILFIAQRPVDPTLFPYDPKHFGNWSVDNYGPIYIPKKGSTTELSLNNLALYRRIIQVYEGNEIEVKDGKIFINGQESNEYTFQQNYYWAMGDNRHNSEDSRAWGFVPEDHIVGKPLFIWFSTKNGSISNGINWDRIFMSASQ